MLGLQEFNRYFPIPTSPASLAKLKEYWNEMNRELGMEEFIPKQKTFKQLTLAATLISK
jgi:hypothetical protein